jgi:uncharacterized FlaG/YvyC family protein
MGLEGGLRGFFMAVLPVGVSSGSSAVASGQPSTPQKENLSNASAAARQLNNLDIDNREFAVVRDPESNRFVVVVREKSTGTVLDQFPPEDILRMLSQLSSAGSKQTGDASE